MIDNIAVISCNIQIIYELLSTGSQTNLLLYTESIMIGLMNIIIVSPWNTSMLPFIYSFNKILKVFFIIHTFST